MLIISEWDGRIRKGQRFETLGNEVLTGKLPEHCEDVFVVDIPASNLLINHLQARIVGIHARVTCNILKSNK
jgi:hypothetical protein